MMEKLITIVIVVCPIASLVAIIIGRFDVATYLSVTAFYLEWNENR